MSEAGKNLACLQAPHRHASLVAPQLVGYLDALGESQAGILLSQFSLLEPRSLFSNDTTLLALSAANLSTDD